MDQQLASKKTVMKLSVLLASLLVFIYCPAQLKKEKPEWKFSTKGRIVASPYIDHSTIYYGSEDGNFYCHSLNDGKLLWQYATKQPIRSSAIVGEGKVFFGCDDGNVYALDATTGKLMWQFATKGERSYDLWDYYRSSPAFHKGKIVVGSGDGNIYCINASNGRELWHYTTGDIVHADPVISKDTVYVGSFDGQLYALDGETGRLIWKFKTTGDRFFPKGEIQKAALVTSDAIYFGSRDYNLYALNKSTGTGLWNLKEYGSWIIATPCEKDGLLFFGTSDSHAFYSLNNFYGERKWKAPLPLRSYATPVPYDTLIFAACFDGCVYGFGKSTGKIEWIFQTDGSKANYSKVFEVKGKFRKDFKLYGSDTVTKAAEQKIMSLGAILSTPAIKDGVLYFGSADGSLYAVRID